jgi:hypothetical protein
LDSAEFEPPLEKRVPLELFLSISDVLALRIRGFEDKLFAVSNDEDRAAVEPSPRSEMALNDFVSMFSVDSCSLEGVESFFCGDAKRVDVAFSDEAVEPSKELRKGASIDCDVEFVTEIEFRLL